VAFQAQSYSGPIPLPEHLAEYDRIVPGAARAIFEEFQANGRHSREIERAGLSGMMRKDSRAQWIATSLVLVGFGLVYELAMNGFGTAAIAVAAGLLGTVVTAFLTGSIDLATRFRRKEP
jgi:uncharacterized membrane protein